MSADGKLKIGRFSLVTHTDNTTQAGFLTDISEFGVTVEVRDPHTKDLSGVFFSNWRSIKTIGQTPGGM